MGLFQVQVWLCRDIITLNFFLKAIKGDYNNLFINACGDKNVVLSSGGAMYHVVQELNSEDKEVMNAYSLSTL